MDYLTSYGTQLFLPFNVGHYTADAVYIIDCTHSALMITGLLLVRMIRRQRQERYGRASLVWVGLGGIAWLAAPALTERPLTLLALQSAGLHVMAFALVVALMAWVCRHWKEHRAVVFGQVGVGVVLGYVALCGDPCCSAAPDGACTAPCCPPSPWGRAVAMASYRCDGHDLSRQPCLYFPRDCDSASEYCERPGLRSQCDPSRQPVPSGACVWDFARFPVVDYYIQKAETIVRYTDLRFSGDGCNRSWFDLTIHFDCGHMSLVPTRCAPDHRRSHPGVGAHTHPAASQAGLLHTGRWRPWHASTHGGDHRPVPTQALQSAEAHHQTHPQTSLPSWSNPNTDTGDEPLLSSFELTSDSLWSHIPSCRAKFERAAENAAAGGAAGWRKGSGTGTPWNLPPLTGA